MATRRPSFVSSARYTWPIPPDPSGEMILSCLMTWPIGMVDLQGIVGPPSILGWRVPSAEESSHILSSTRNGGSVCQQVAIVGGSHLRALNHVATESVAPRGSGWVWSAER